jgi:hypothetical protein
MLTRNADQIRRLNVLLGLAKVDLEEITPIKWNALLDDLYWAILASKRRIYDQTKVFHRAAHRDGVRAAQEGIRGQLYQLQHATPQKGPILLENYPSFELAKQTVYLFVGDNGFFPRYVSIDFPTMAYQMLYFLVDKLKLKPSDFLTCGYCTRVFVPLRKPHGASTRHFCSQRCGNIVSARESRGGSTEEMKAHENERSHRVYKKRIERARGRPTRVKRLPRGRLTRKIGAGTARRRRNLEIP